MSDYRFVAPIYDLLLSPFLADIRRHVVDIVKAHQPDNILDVCCGTGDQLRRLKKDGFRVVGVDLSEAMLRVARKGDDAPDCRLQDATKMTFADGAFDFVIITLALHETAPENGRKMLAEIHRVLSPGGHLLVVDYDLSGGTRAVARRIINFIEFLAGGDHYQGFRAYNRNGGLMSLIDKNHFITVKHKHRAGKSIILQLFKKNSEK